MEAASESEVPRPARRAHRAGAARHLRNSEERRPRNGPAANARAAEPRTAARAVRRIARGREAESRRVQRRSDERDLVARHRRQNDLRDAARGSRAHDHPQSPVSPPRTADDVPAFSRCAGAGRVRTVRGRESVHVRTSPHPALRFPRAPLPPEGGAKVTAPRAAQAPFPPPPLGGRGWPKAGGGARASQTPPQPPLLVLLVPM